MHIEKYELQMMEFDKFLVIDLMDNDKELIMIHQIKHYLLICMLLIHQK